MALGAAQEPALWFILYHAYSEVFCEHLPQTPCWEGHSCVNWCLTAGGSFYRSRRRRGWGRPSQGIRAGFLEEVACEDGGCLCR